MRRSKYVVQPSFSPVFRVSYERNVRTTQLTEVLPRSVADEIATPAVRELVSDDIHILPVFADDCGSCKCEDWVLHATI